MRRILTLIMTLLLLAVPVRPTAVSAEEEDSGSSAAPEEAWVPAPDSAVTEEVDGMVQESLNGLVGVEYLPVTYLGSRQRDGETEHAVLCQARVVVPGAEPRFVIFYLKESNDGDIQLLKIAEFDIGAFYEAK